MLVRCMHPLQFRSSPMIKMIWAQDLQRNIGYQGKIAWYLPADLQHFKKETLGHVMVMGSKTFTSLPKVLPKRKHYVLTHHPEKYDQIKDNPQVKIFTDLAELKNAVQEINDDVYVIGGRTIFDQFMDLADELIVTQIDSTFKGDVKASQIDMNKFKVIDREFYQRDEKNKYDYEIIKYQKLV